MGGLPGSAGLLILGSPPVGAAGVRDEICWPGVDSGPGRGCVVVCTADATGIGVPFLVSGQAPTGAVMNIPRIGVMSETGGPVRFSTARRTARRALTSTWIVAAATGPARTAGVTVTRSVVGGIPRRVRIRCPRIGIGVNALVSGPHR